MSTNMALCGGSIRKLQAKWRSSSAHAERRLLRHRQLQRVRVVQGGQALWPQSRAYRRPLVQGGKSASRRFHGRISRELRAKGLECYIEVVSMYELHRMSMKWGWHCILMDGFIIILLMIIVNRFALVLYFSVFGRFCF